MSLCVAKKLPSCAWVFNMYDKNNRLIFIQDGDQRQRGEWAYSIPDAFGRTSVVGVCRNTFNVFNQSIKDQQIIVCPDFNEAFGYAIKNDVIELFNPTVLEVNYYDNYDFLKNDYFDHSDLTYNLENGFDKRFYCDKAVGLMTGHLKAVMNKEAIAGYLSSIMYYDYRGRQVQMKSTNQLINGFEKEYFAYDFIGQLLKRKHVHSSKDQAIQTEQYSYTYDRAGRALMTTHQLNGNPPILLMDNKYDAIGRLKYNSRNSGVNLRTDYTYNLRSWVKSLNTPIFSQTLYYQDSRGGDSNIIPSYSGNISSMDWAWFSPGGDAKQHGYDFTYDGLSRLTSADYLEDGACNGNFSTSYAYDKHGNLSSLKRSGTKVSGGYGLLDDLTLSYRGNQLKNVADKSLSQGSPVCMSFEDGSAQDVEYTYDANGNLTKDLNKKILNIQYNYLNLPSRIVFENGNAISYVYGADGTKLRTTHVIGNDTTVTDYCGNVIYENSIPVKLLTEGGYVTLNDHKYHYFIQDHQGNNRLVVDEDGVVEEKNDYYPFGGLMSSSSSSVQPYKYNGKELDTKNGLNWYDYGARMYDAVLGRWHVMDPMAEKYYGWSPYVYCKNNPVLRVDIDGKDDYTINSAGRLFRTTVKGSTSDRLMSTRSGVELITVKDKELLSGMYSKQDSKLGGLEIYNSTSSLEDATAVFKFGADNTSVEWKLDVYNDNGSKVAIIGTSGKEGSVFSDKQSELNVKGDKVVDMHSHPYNAQASDHDMKILKIKTGAVYHRDSKVLFFYNSGNSRIGNNEYKIDTSKTLLDKLKDKFMK